MVKLSSQDALWLEIEHESNHLIIDTMMWFDQPLDVDAVRQLLNDRLLASYPVFRSRLSVNDEWVEVEHLSLDDHLHVRTVDSEADLVELLSSARSQPLAANRPLWEVWLVDIKSGNMRYAVHFRCHHSMADGVRLTQVLFHLCEETSAPPTVGRDLSRSTFHKSRDVITSSVANVADIATSALPTRWFPPFLQTLQAGILPSARSTISHPHRTIRGLQDLFQSDNRWINDAASVAKIVSTDVSDELPWRGQPGPHKALGWITGLPLEDAKDRGKRDGYSVNDVLVNVVAQALSTYAINHGRQPANDVWFIPMSVKPYANDGVLGNYFALIVLDLPLDESDPDRRLDIIHARMERIKNSDEPLFTYAAQWAISQAPRGSVALSRFFSNKGSGVLTNVPGPRRPVTFTGVPVQGMLGWAPCSGNQTMSISIFSYNGEVSLGVAADADIVTDLPTFLDTLREAWDDVCST